MKYVAALLAIGLIGCSRNETTSQATPEIKTFGERQVEQMLEDRPDMQGIMPMSHPVVQWVIDSFNGKYLGKRIYWNADSPHGGVPAENFLPAEGMAFVAVTGGTELTPVDKWASVVYELHNIQNDFQQVIDKALVTPSRFQYQYQ